MPDDDKWISIQVRLRKDDIDQLDQMRREAADLPSRAEICVRAVKDAIAKAAKKREGAK